MTDDERRRREDEELARFRSEALIQKIADQRSERIVCAAWGIEWSEDGSWRVEARDIANTHRQMREAFKRGQADKETMRKSTLEKLPEWIKTFVTGGLGMGIVYWVLAKMGITKQ